MGRKRYLGLPFSRQEANDNISGNKTTCVLKVSSQEIQKAKSSSPYRKQFSNEEIVELLNIEPLCRQGDIVYQISNWYDKDGIEQPLSTMPVYKSTFWFEIVNCRAVHTERGFFWMIKYKPTTKPTDI